MYSNLDRSLVGAGRAFSLVRVFTASAALLACIAPSASAAFIIDSLRYDGHVRSGATTGIEQHFTSVNFPPPSVNHPLPATNPPLPAPLQAAYNLNVDLIHANMAPLNGGTSALATIWISNATALHSFRNALDTTLATPPVEFEAFVFLDDLAPGSKLILNHIGVEGGSGVPPWPAPATSQVSGTGSQQDPLRILLGLNANQVELANRIGQVKIQLYYDTMIIPEPASFALFGIGVVAIAGLRRRHSPQA